MPTAVSTATIVKPIPVMAKCMVTVSGTCHWSRYPNAEGYKYCVYCGMVNDIK